jgi:hypothetical protein
MMDFFLEKDITTLIVLYTNLQLEGIDRYMMTMQKKIQGALEALEFEQDSNCKDYLKREDLKLRDVTFNLVQWMSIIYPLKEDSSIRWMIKISLFMKKSNKVFSMRHLMVSSFNVLLILQLRCMCWLHMVMFLHSFMCYVCKGNYFTLI